MSVDEAMAHRWAGAAAEDACRVLQDEVKRLRAMSTGPLASEHAELVAALLSVRADRDRLAQQVSDLTEKLNRLHSETDEV